MSVMTIPMTFIMITIMILKLSVVIMMINKIPQTMFNLMIIMLIIMVLIIKIIRVIYMKGLPVSMLPLLWYSFTQPSKPRPPQLARALLSALFQHLWSVRVIFANKCFAPNWHFWPSKMCLRKSSQTRQGLFVWPRWQCISGNKIQKNAKLAVMCKNSCKIQKKKNLKCKNLREIWSKCIKPRWKSSGRERLRRSEGEM